VLEGLAEKAKRQVKLAVHGAIGAAGRSKFFTPPRPETPGAVLVSGYTGLGHFVLKSVLIRHIEELYPGCKVSIIAGNTFGTEQLLDGYETLILQPESSALRKLIFFWRLRRRRFDAVFLPCDAAPKFLIRGCVLAGIPIRVGHVFEGQSTPSYYYTVRVPVRRNGPRNEIDLNLDLLEAVYGKPFPRNYNPVVDVDRRALVSKAYGLLPKRYFCVQIGAANGLPTAKRWPEDHFRELLQRILEAHPEIAIVALGDKGDAPIVKRVCQGIVSKRLNNLAGITSLQETKSLIASGKFLICHDSGLLHIGNAVGTPVIALYGPSDADEYALRLPTFHILREACDCSPPLGLFPGLYEETEAERAARCPGPKCMRLLTVDRVYAKCAELLEQ
jgi:ADP-heptose:LPS heptosyltransferase